MLWTLNEAASISTSQPQKVTSPALFTAPFSTRWQFISQFKTKAATGHSKPSWVLHSLPVVRFMCCDEFWRRFCRAAIHLMTQAHTHTHTENRWCLGATPPAKVQLFKFQGSPPPVETVTSV